MPLPVWQRWIGYLSETQSMRSIARQTGISRGRLTRHMATGTAFDRANTLAIRRVYQRTSYANLRTEGMSASQARRFQWQIPEVVGLTQGRMIDIVDRLALGRMGARIRRFERLGIAYDWEDLYFESKELVSEGLRKSKKSIEEWEAY